MNAIQLIGIAVVLLVLGVLAKVLLGRRSGMPAVEVDTVAGSPTTTRPLNSAERKAWRLLHRATPPNYILMPQVAIARFVKVSHRTSYRAWYDKIGHRCVDFLICDAEGEVVVVIELDEKNGGSAGYSKVVDRKARVMTAAQIPVIHWNSADLPSATAAREQIELAELGQTAGRPRAVPSGLVPLAPKGQTLPSPLTPENEEFNRRWNADLGNRGGSEGADVLSFSDKQKRDIERSIASRGAADPWTSKA
jgi:Protein of unknown function (DUF2726)